MNNSEIREYLTNGDFVSKFSLNNLVSAATIRELPTESISDFASDVDSAYKTAAKAINNCADKLWLLSQTEESIINMLMGTHIAYCPSQSNQINVDVPTEYGVAWRLRSPYSEGWGASWYVVIDGEVSVNNVDEVRAVRPGFQLNLGT